jgi:hypothetical protein
MKKTVLKVIKDGWKNVITGLGVAGKDKQISASVSWNKLNRGVQEALFAGDAMASKVARTVPFDGTREGITWKFSDEDTDEDSKDIIKSVDGEFDRLKVWNQYNWAWTLARAYGGALAFLSVDDGSTDLAEPLELSRLREIKAIKVFDRWELEIESADIISDLGDPLYGTPEFYRYTPSGMLAGAESYIKIHHSRVIRFDGDQLPDRLFIRNNYWHDSIYTKLREPVRDYATTLSSMASLAQEINQPVYRMDAMTEAVAADESELILNRLEFINQMRSSMRAIVLDKEDEFALMDSKLAGVKDIVQLIKERLVAATDIPHTRLLGESAGASLGEQGKSELIDYYDTVAAQQEVKLRDPLNRIIEVIFAQQSLKVSAPENMSFEFKPLYQEDQKTIIETKKLQAEIDVLYTTMGAYDSFDVAESRFNSGEYSYETQIQEKERNDFKEGDDKNPLEDIPEPKKKEPKEEV